MLFSGEAAFDLDVASGFSLAIVTTAVGIFDFLLSGYFDPDTQGGNPVDVNLTLSDAVTFDPAVNARGVEQVEIAAGMVALLFGDLTGGSNGDFTG